MYQRLILFVLFCSSLILPIRQSEQYYSKHLQEEPVDLSAVDIAFFHPSKDMMLSSNFYYVAMTILTLLAAAQIPLMRWDSRLHLDLILAHRHTNEKNDQIIRKLAHINTIQIFIGTIVSVGGFFICYKFFLSKELIIYPLFLFLWGLRKKNVQVDFLSYLILISVISLIFAEIIILNLTPEAKLAETPTPLAEEKPETTGEGE